MERHALLALLLLSLILFDSSDASFVRSFRKLVDSNPQDKETPIAKTKDSPPPSEKKLDPNEEKKKEVNPPSSSNNINNNITTTSNNTNIIVPVPQPQPLSKVENGTVSKQEETNNKTNTPPPASAPPPVPKKADDSGKVQEEEKEKNGGIKLSHSTTSDTCDDLNSCKDEGDMLACISKMGPKYFVVLLQNRGGGTIKVKLRSDFESNLGDVEVDKNKTEKVTISGIRSESAQLTLNAGKGDCVLHTVTPIPKESFFLRLPSYDQILTPVNGAYFLILAVLVFGGTWACCMFKKKRHDEIPYQELEMAMPESASATNVESADGWDQVWDDDWDDNVAVKSPSVRLAGSISANGLTSRSSNKDGWEDNWDD